MYLYLPNYSLIQTSAVLMLSVPYSTVVNFLDCEEESHLEEGEVQWRF